MQLTRDEQEMLEGKEGPARQKAMELLVKYGEALGAEKFVDTNNVYFGIGAFPYVNQLRTQDADAIYSEFYLDSQEKVVIPQVKAFTTTTASSMDVENWQILGVDKARYEINALLEKLCSRIGINLTTTCIPYQVGNVPVKGEHCAWMESSAVPYCNAVLGGRTNLEGMESCAAAALTGKIPLWGLHIDENRLGTHLVNVDIALKSGMDWDLLGYYTGEAVQLGVPVFNGVQGTPNLSKLVRLGAALNSSGSALMYHIVGITFEAPNLGEAFGKNKPVATINFGAAERREAYNNLTSAKDSNVDFVVLGCPHYSIEQLWKVSRLLEGKHIHGNTELWIWTARQIKTLADRNGFTEIITNAGGHLFTDTCPCLGKLYPEGAKVVATDAAKQAHYIPAILGLETWYGSTEDCVLAAISGQWRGELK